MTREEQIGQALLQIWEDQQAFNTLFRKPPTNVDEMTKQVRDFVLYTESELHELLRIFKWKEHRRGGTMVNMGHAENELADILKFVMSLFQICGMTPERLIEAYWEKTAVVRQRYQEEWVNKIVGPCAVIDIDMVLCDYIGGMCDWLLDRRYMLTKAQLDRVSQVKEGSEWINGEALGIPEATWQAYKHEFRVTGAKRYLPAFPDARPFLEAVRARGMQIVLLTSRPIDRYPNIQTDTLLWLQEHHLPFDFLWWSFDKTERILDSAFRDYVKFVIDDDQRHLAGFVKLGIPCFLLRRDAKTVYVKSEQITTIQILDPLILQLV